MTDIKMSKTERKKRTFRFKQAEAGPEMRPVPVFCRECRGQNTYEPNPRNDIKNEKGDKVLWAAWKCGKCGHETLVPDGKTFFTGDDAVLEAHYNGVR